MIYIKYIWKNDPSVWSIWKYQKGEMVEHFVVASYYKDILSKRIKTHPKNDKEHFKIKYLTKKEIDLLKLELL